MEILTKLFACYVLLVCLNSETAEKECIDMWPFCHIYNPPCLNKTDQVMDIHVQCPKQCGLCASSKNDSQNADVTCKDKLDCSPFNLSEGCQSNNTWYIQHCRKACNMCLSDNETTTEGCEIQNENSTIHTGKNVLGKIRWADDKKVIISVIGSVVVVIVVGNIVVYFILVKNRKGLCSSHSSYMNLGCCVINLIFGCCVNQPETWLLCDQPDAWLLCISTRSLPFEKRNLRRLFQHASTPRLNGSHTHEGKQEQVQSHSDVQMADNAEIESCSEPSIHVYDEVGDILNETATGEQTRRTNQSQHNMLIIENVTDHSETIMYLHPYSESPYSLCRQTLEDEHPLRTSNADIDNFATSDNHEYHNLRI